MYVYNLWATSLIDSLWNMFYEGIFETCDCVCDGKLVLAFSDCFDGQMYNPLSPDWRLNGCQSDFGADGWMESDL